MSTPTKLVKTNCTRYTCHLQQPWKPWILHFTLPGLKKSWNFIKNDKNREFWKHNLEFSKLNGSNLFLEKKAQSIYLPGVFDLENYNFNQELTWKRPEIFGLFTELGKLCLFKDGFSLLTPLRDFHPCLYYYFGRSSHAKVSVSVVLILSKLNASNCSTCSTCTAYLYIHKASRLQYPKQSRLDVPVVRYRRQLRNHNWGGGCFFWGGGDTQIEWGPLCIKLWEKT